MFYRKTTLTVAACLQANPRRQPGNQPCRQMSCRFALCCQHSTAAITEAAQPARPEKHHSDNMSSSSHRALKHKIHKNKA